MSPRILRPLALLAALVVGPAAARAQSDRAAAESMALSGTVSGSYRSKASDWMIMPGGTTTFGGTLTFLTADQGLSDQPLRFTDVVLLSLQVRRSFLDRFELFASSTLLPKQPSYSDELIWQGAEVGGRIGAGKRYAGLLSLAGGPLLGHSLPGQGGYWGAGILRMEARKSLHETLVVEGGLGGATTVLFEDARDRASWLTELTASGQLVFRDPRNMFAGWFGTEFRFPVAHDSEQPAYDPQTRVNVHLGTVLAYIDDWDIFARFSIIDRGDATDPATTLPILEGGFDQKEIVIGVTRRFKPAPKRPDAYIAE